MVKTFDRPHLARPISRRHAQTGRFGDVCVLRVQAVVAVRPFDAARFTVYLGESGSVRDADRDLGVGEGAGQEVDDGRTVIRLLSVAGIRDADQIPCVL